MVGQLFFETQQVLQSEGSHSENLLEHLDVAVILDTEDFPA